MNKFKKWDDIDAYDGPLYNRRNAAISKVVKDFYQKVKGQTNVISGQEVYKLCDSFSFFSTSIWYNKIFIRGSFYQGRELTPVIFGLKSGIVFKEEDVYFITGNDTADYWDIHILWISNNIKIEGNKIYDPRYSTFTKVSNQEDVKLLKEFINELTEIKNKFNADIESDINQQNQLQKIKQENLNVNRKNQILNFDQDGDGKIDLIENDFNKLFTKNQKRVIEIDKSYIYQFVKISNYIKTKKQNTQTIFESIRDTSSQEELEERVNLLKNQIHAYELLVFHSINMIGALVSEDLISFYEIYESFDKLAMFNSNWENEMSEKLTNIGDKLDDLIYSIYNMEQNIVSELRHLSYVTQESFEDLNRSVTGQLKEIESSINMNNLLTGINAYQLYKINKNTKSLRC
jgi:hypothetical protein